jgi:hypothetical protein
MSGPLQVIIVLLIVVPLFPISAAFILARHAFSDVPLLRERTFIAIRDAVVAIIIAFAAANRVFGWNMDSEFVAGILGVALMLISLASVTWLWWYFRNGFR